MTASARNVPFFTKGQKSCLQAVEAYKRRKQEFGMYDVKSNEDYKSVQYLKTQVLYNKQQLEILDELCSRSVGLTIMAHRFARHWSQKLEWRIATD